MSAPSDKISDNAATDIASCTRNKNGHEDNTSQWFEDIFTITDL